ncbi:MAG TPA: NERD domain-containing protein [Galbitalea sp.]|jgi:hypothetical protein|nr:NERD domain-containing protein [Galbitalea sp.]
MTRMIPYLCDDSAPPGEKALFEKLRDAPGTGDWVAFHSLNIAKHLFQVEGEADFVVIAPGIGLLVIEVKSHERVEADGAGRWKLGNHEWTAKSPFDQASGAMHSIQHFLDSHGANVFGFPIWYAVWLTSISKEKVPQSIGVQEWSLLDASDLNSGNVGTVIARVLGKASDQLAATVKGYRWAEGAPTETQVNRILQLIEPPFTAQLTPSEASRRRESDLIKHTAEQVNVLRMLAGSPRLIVEGPPGSGKTVLAVEAAHRASALGDRVLFVVYNRLIEAEIQLRCDDADVYRIHALMAKLAGLKIPRGADKAFYDALPEKAFVAVAEAVPRYDMLVVDEAQDLANSDYLDVLDSLLVGGLRDGRSVIAGDFDSQNLYQPNVTASEAKNLFLDRLDHPVQLKLSVNTRNTPELGDFFELMSGKSGIYSEFRRVDDEQVSVHNVEYDSPERQEELLGFAVEQILSEPFTVRDLIILSPIRASAASLTTDPALKNCLGHDITDPNLIRWGTIHEFKGMEAPAVILTDIDDSNPHLESLFFVGMTRATDRLIVLRKSSTH